MENLPNKLKELRRKANLSQAELAKMLGFKGYAQVSRYELGSHTPPLNVLKELGKILNYDFISLVADPQQVEDASTVPISKYIGVLEHTSKVMEKSIASSLDNIQQTQRVLLQTMATNHDVVVTLLSSIKADTKATASRK